MNGSGVRIVTPLRFVSGVVTLWIAGRALVLMPDILAPAAEADVPGGGRITAGSRPLAGSPATVAPVPVAMDGAGHPTLAARSDEPAAGASVFPDRAARIATAGGPRAYGAVGDRHRRGASDPQRAPQGRAITVGQNALADVRPAPAATRRGDSTGETIARAEAIVSPVGIVAASPPAGPSRWSGNLYLYRRGDGAAALASGGQLGGSQAGGRIAWALNPHGPARIAAAARVSTPLDDRRGAEAAAGLDWHPLPGRPLRVSVERRVDLGGAGRNAWSAYAAGGFWREVRPGFVVDGYAQAGVVGARRRDLFADGALRAGARRELGPGRSLTVGAGAWAAAQPRVERIDIGPRVALGLPVGGTAATIAAEWRVRVAGDAAPRDGLAITLAADF